MKTVESLLDDLDRSGVELWLEGDHLRYRAPQGALSAELLAELRGRRGELREVVGLASRELPPVIVAPRDTAIPLAVGQEGLWTLEKFIPGSSYSNVFAAFQLRGRLNIGILQHVFDEIVCRHEILRTTFTAVDTGPVQIVSPSRPIGVLVEDLTMIPAEEREVACLRHAIRQAHGPFDLACGPLMRPVVLRIDEQDHLLMLTMHHIVSDAWSLRVIGSELIALYDAFSHGRESPLSELPVQYADFAIWQRKVLSGSSLEAQRRYWVARLDGGNLPDLNIPIDHPRSASLTFRTARVPIDFPASVVDALKVVSNDAGCTLFVTILSALKVLLSRLCGQTDVRVGALVANRNRPEIEGLIGLFINTIVLRTDLSGDPTLRNIVERVRQTVFEALENLDLPFEDLVQSLKRGGKLTRASVVQVMLLFEHHPPTLGRLDHLTVEAVDVGQRLTAANVDINVTLTTFDLIFRLGPTSDGLGGSLLYKTELFSLETVNRMLADLTAVLGALPIRLDEPLSRALPAP